MNDFHLKRCFVAMPLDIAARADILELAGQLNGPDMRAVDAANLHITVKFLGDVEDPKIPALIDALREAVSDTGELSIQATGLTLFPTHRRPRVLALTLDCPAELAAMFQRVEQALYAVGFRKEGRAYHPHVTLGRYTKPPRRMPQVDGVALPPITVDVDRVQLMQSVLERSGAMYTPLAAIRLD